MAGGINKVILIGNLGKDPEIKSFENGGKLANFSLATTENWKDSQTNEKKSRTDWHNITISRPSLAGIAEQYLKKGMQIYVEGKLRTRSYTTKEGETKYITEVVCDDFQMLGSKSSEGSLSGGFNAPSTPEAVPAPDYSSNGSDDLPF
ncbi:MAG: single-stranded DNA-binding protein [Crocinitomicaceae bacterium]|nr:single-stranded DNA-binding protein [Crocinitomicaceae bacterium]